MGGSLYIVSTSIGNHDDISLRALKAIRQCDDVICEELRIGSTLLAHHQIEKPLVALNEHTEGEVVPALLERLVHGASLALISDHGTPLLNDPGASLVKSAIEAGIPVIPVPGASAPIAALVASGMPGARFRFLGQLPANASERRKALTRLKEDQETCVVLDAPYRLMPLLNSVQEELGSDRPVALACDLTKPDERIFRGNVAEVIEQLERQPFKGEFVLLIGGVKQKSASVRRAAVKEGAK